jgi:predicted  nucleic acid-binding Zn-ribbon protein
MFYQHWMPFLDFHHIISDNWIGSIKIEIMTQEQMQQKASEARREAKALQQKLQTVTDPDERKMLARQMNELFAHAASLRDEAKHLHYQEQSIERDFRCMETNLED